MATYLYDEALVKKIKHWIQSTNVHVYGSNETQNLFEVIADESNDSPIELPIITIRRDRGYNIIDGGTTKRPLSYDGFDIADQDFDSYDEALDFCNTHGLDEEVIYPKSYWINTLVKDQYEYHKFETYAQAAEYCEKNDIPRTEIHTVDWSHYYIKSSDIHPKYVTAIRAIPISISYQLDVYARYAKEADLLMRNLVFNIINYPAFTISIPKANLTHTARLVLGDVISDNSDIPERFIEGNMTRLTASLTVDNARLWDTRQLRTAELEVIFDDIYERQYDPYFPIDMVDLDRIQS